LNLQDDHDVDENEQVTRFGCGALLGAFAGLWLIIAFALSSSGAVAGVLVVSMFVCGGLALVYGDRFWYALKDWL